MYNQINSLHLNGSLLNKSGLLHYCHQVSGNPQAEEWESYIAEFIRSWLDDSQELSVKTSGSTGAPKEITLLKNNMLNSAQGSIDALGLGKGSRALLCMPARFIAGKMMIVRAMLGGWELQCIKPVLNPLKDTGVTANLDFTAITPMQLSAILEDKESRQNLETIGKIIVGGAALTDELISQCRKLKTEVYETYGMTETISHIALRKVNGDSPHEYFRVLPGVTIRQDERKCLVIQAAGISEHEIVSNDIVEIQDKDCFWFIGRFDNIINTGGVKISPEIVENKLKNLISRSFYITSVEDKLLGRKIILVMEGEPMTAHSEKALLEKCRQILDKFEMPKEISYLPQLPRTETGKIIRK